MTNKKVLVEILRTTAGVGKQGEVKEVSTAQARNQLIPQGIAKEVSGKKQSNSTDASNLKAHIYESRHEIAKKLKGKTLEVPVEVHGSRITGHFDAKDVVTAIKNQYQTKILAEMITFEDVKHPKKIGDYDFHIDIADDAYVRMKLIISTK